jgi:hypothetical protein
MVTVPALVDPALHGWSRAGIASLKADQPDLENLCRFSKWIIVLETKGVGRKDMTDLNLHSDKNVYDLNAILHPGTVFDHPRDVLADATLSKAEKRAILASWASDAAAVTSCPSLRAIPGAKSVVSIDEILEALASLDHSPRTPPGGKPVRLRSTDRVAMAA